MPLRAEISSLQRECGRSVAMLEAALVELEGSTRLHKKAKARGMENGEDRLNPSLASTLRARRDRFTKRLGDALAAT